MTIKAALSAATLAAPPGQEAGCDVHVTNAGRQPVTVDLGVSGPAAAWAVVVPASLVVAPGGSAMARVVVDVPREHILAGTERELAIGVVPRDPPAPAVQLAGRVAVVESRDVRASVTPLVARARGAVTYTVTIANHGTGRRRVALSLPEEDQVGLGIRLAPAQVVVAAGEEATAELTVRPRRAHLGRRARSHRVVVRAEPDAGPVLTAAATHFQEPLRWRAPSVVVALGMAAAGMLSVPAGGGSRPLLPPAAGPAISTIAASACSEPAAGGPARVAVAGFAYCQERLTVAAGTEVVWANADVSRHTATFDGPDDPFDSGLLAQGQEWSRRFERAGTYQYYCRLHPGMSGTIVVT